MADYEYIFDPDAVNNTASSVYRLVRSGGERVLDLGSGPAIVAAYLAEQDGKNVTCLDNSPASLDSARQRGIKNTVEADLADPSWAASLGGQSFDVVVIADALEHLVDPGQVLETIVDREILATDGCLVISVPNAGHEAVLAELIRGRFTYQDTGLLDSTHLRFFTLASLRELLERAGFFITQVHRTHRTAEQTSLAIHDVALPTELRDRVLKASPDAQTYQFVVKAERADAARELADAREQLERTAAELAERARVVESEATESLVAERDAAVAAVTDLSQRAREMEAVLAEARRDAAQAEQRLAEAFVALDRERKLTATERKRHEQALAETRRNAGRAGTDAVRQEVARLEKKLEDVYQSRTWKVGRAAWSAFHIPAKVLKRSRDPKRPVVPIRASLESAPIAVNYAVVENMVVRDKYEEGLQRHVFSGSAKSVVMAVSTTDLDAGRGDVFTAVGLGRRLEEIGYEVIYLPSDRWYDIPAGTEIYVAMLETVDVSRLPADVIAVAWVRNQTAAWIQQPWLPLYDMILASAQPSLDAISAVYPGPTCLLPIGVDIELFATSADPEDRQGVVSTVNQWGREREVFAHLKERAPDFPLSLYGQRRAIAPELEPYARGPLSFFALPSLYNQARIVLDDFNHTTAAFGNVNSRLFEATACGALVMTNRSVGLAALGLGETPVFSTAAELFKLIDDGLNSGEALTLAEQRRQTVVDRHSYRQRADEFSAHIERLDTQAGPGAGIVVSHYPNYRDNPYTEMMWSDLRRQRSITIPVDNRLNFTATVRAAAHRRTVFHLNWTAPILGGAADEHDRLVRHRRFLEALEEMRTTGIPSIWTVHNVLPHECADQELEAQLRQEIADRVDVVHVMCEETVTACAQWFEIPKSKLRVVPHPSYIDVYPNLVDRETARQELKLGSSDFVYLHFGQIRPYKGVDKLLDAFDQVSREDPTTKLLLVGKPGRFEGVRQIVDRARANPNVISNFNPIPDADVQLYMNAADVVMLPHQAALNSGALLLAYSFARPVVAAESGCIGGLVDDSTGVSFRWDDGGLALQNAMLTGRALGPQHGRAAYARAESFHYLKIAKQFSALVEEVLAR